MFFKSVSDAFSWSTLASSSEDNSPQCQITVRYHNNTHGFGGQRTFIPLAQRFVLPNQVVSLHLHLFHFIMVLGEGAVELGLEQSGMLLRLVQLLLQHQAIGQRHGVLCRHTLAEDRTSGGISQ
jgi:hypothetical protein